jgi:hypothetical protein
VIYPLSMRGGRSKNVLADRSLNPHPHSEMFRSKRCPVPPCLTSMCPTISRPDRPRKRRRNTEIATVGHPRRSMVVFSHVQLLCVQPFLRPDRPENCVTTPKTQRWTPLDSRWSFPRVHLLCVYPFPTSEQAHSTSPPGSSRTPGRWPLAGYRASYPGRPGRRSPAIHCSLTL